MGRLGMLARPAGTSPATEKPEQQPNAEFYEDTKFHLNQYQ